MRDKREFYTILQGLDGQAPSEYTRLTGDFDFSRYVLHNVKIDRLDPAAPDVLFVVHVPQIIAAFPDKLSSSPIRRTALEDYLARRVASAIDRLIEEGSETAEYIRAARPGAVILPRTSIIISKDFVEARLTIRLPIRNGVISAPEALRIFFEDLPRVVSSALIHCNQDETELKTFVDLMEDVDEVRQALFKRELVGFIGEGSTLPWQYGTDERRAARRPAFTMEDTLAIEIDVPNAGRMRGLGIPSGITLIIGDVYSGRVELINAIAAGVYNHVPGDGRERVVTMPDAVQVVAETGRPVQRVNIGAFVGALPGVDPREFTTANAAPGEAQAAGMVEALQVGAQALIFDESSSDPSFLTADAGLFGLDPAYGRRVTPLAARAREIAERLNVSLVIGASSCAAEFIPVADRILFIDDFKVRDVTIAAREIGVIPLPKPPAELADLPSVMEKQRWIVPSSIDPSLGVEDFVIEAPACDRLTFGRATVNLGGVMQIGDPCQTTTIGLVLYHAKLRYLDESRNVSELLDLIDQDISTEGLDTLSREQRGDLARPRRYEIAAALNRLPSLRVTRESQPVQR